MAQNAANLAAAARAPGRQFDGLLIDNAFYGTGNLWNDLDQTLAQRRGEQIGPSIVPSDQSLPRSAAKLKLHVLRPRLPLAQASPRLWPRIFG
jgi:hypothetical protein